MTCALASCVLCSGTGSLSVRRVNAGVTTVYLTTVLILCKSFGATIYALFLVPLVRLASPNLQLNIAKLLVVFALAYPALRFVDLVPTQAMVDIVSSISLDRAGSLQTRFEK